MIYNTVITNVITVKFNHSAIFGAFLMSLLESIGLFIKHVPTQAEAQVHRTAPCDDSWGLQVFQKMRHKLEYSGDKTLLGRMKKFHMEML